MAERYTARLQNTTAAPDPGRYVAPDLELSWGAHGLLIKRRSVVTKWRPREATSLQLSWFTRPGKRGRSRTFLHAELRGSVTQIRLVAPCPGFEVDDLVEREGIGLELPFPTFDACLRNAVAQGAALLVDGPIRSDEPSSALRRAAALLEKSVSALTLVEGHLSPEDLDAFFGLPELAKLRRLNLRGTTLGDAGVELLARCPYLRGLDELKLPRTGIGDVGVSALAHSDFLSRLRVLVLRGNDFGPEACRALAESMFLHALFSLNLGATRVGDAGLEAILWAAHRLEELVVSDADVSIEGFRELVVSPLLTRLRYLKIGRNALGDAALEALLSAAEQGRLASIHTLDLADCGFSGEALVDFIEALELPGLFELVLSENPVGDAGARAFARATGLPDLQILRLQGCGVSSAGARAMIEAETCEKIHTLDLRGNALDAELWETLKQRLFAVV